MRKTSAFAAAAAIILAIITDGAPASARAAEQPQEHCVIHVVDRTPDGELLVSEPACYATFGEAMRAEGVDAWGADAARVDAVTAATFTIGTHFDGANFTGSSMSVVGSDCAGGWLNVSASWNNRISSTMNGCPRIRHYSGYNLTGSTQDTYSPGGNLTVLDNQTSSIRYLT